MDLNCTVLAFICGAAFATNRATHPHGLLNLYYTKMHSTFTNSKWVMLLEHSASPAILEIEYFKENKSKNPF